MKRKTIAKAKIELKKQTLGTIQKSQLTEVAGASGCQCQGDRGMVAFE